MGMTLYEYGPSRSARCRWLIQELNLQVESVDGREVIQSEALKKIHPMGKVPALVDGDFSLFESAAICNYLADKYPEHNLIPRVGTRDRALHDQWCYFAYNELEAYLWSTARHSSLYPEDKRVPEIINANTYEAKKALAVLDAHLSTREYLVGDRFGVTDIIVGYLLNWARRAGFNEFTNINTYVDRLLARPYCPLATIDKATKLT